MSAPVFFQSAGRGDLLCWGGEEGLTVVIWESLSEHENESWLKESSTMHDSCGASQTKGWRKSAHLSSAGKKSSLTMMKRNRKWKRTKKKGAKRRHIAGRAYDTNHGGSNATSKWQWARITLHAGFTKISLSQQNKCRLCWQQQDVERKGRMSSTTDRYRAGILDGHRDRQITRLRLPRHSHSGWWI